MGDRRTKADLLREIAGLKITHRMDRDALNRRVFELEQELAQHKFRWVTTGDSTPRSDHYVAPKAPEVAPNASPVAISVKHNF